MARYRVTTPDTPRAPGCAYADFQAASEHDGAACVRHLLERYDFAGCTVHRKRRGNYWELIFDTSLLPECWLHSAHDYWARVESAQ